MKESDDKIYGFEDKWSSAIAMYNFTQVPNLLLKCQGHLELKDGELLTLIHLFTFWFHLDTRIYPSIPTLCRFSDKGYATVQRRLRQLEEKGFIKRHHHFGTSNTYDVIPCIHKLTEHQKECTDVHKQSGYWNKMMRVPTPLVMRKEDSLRIPIKNTVNRSITPTSEVVIY